MIQVSVIIPVYNAEKYISRCIDSVLGQSMQEIEVICVDDASKDSSLSILKQYEAKDSRIRVIVQKENAGAAASRNLALQEAKGAYVYFLDADDYLDAEALEKLSLYAKETCAQLCFFKTKLVAEEGMELGRVPKGIMGSYPGVYTGSEMLEEFVNNREFFYYPWSLLFQRKFLEENQLLFQHLLIGEGGDFVLRSLLNADVVVVLDGSYHNYYIHPMSVTNKDGETDTVLLGQVAQYISVLKHTAVHGKKGNEVFLDYQYRKIIGGIANLRTQQLLKFQEKFQDPFSNHVFQLLTQSQSGAKYEFFKEDVSVLREKKRVIIYGAGNAVRSVLDLVNRYEIVVQAIAVSSKKNNPDVLYGYCVREIAELTDYTDECVVIVALKKKYHDEVGKRLKELGFSEYVFLDVEI